MAKFADIEKFLKERGVEYEVINLPDTAISVDDVVRLSGGQVKEEEIIKTLIAKGRNGQFTAFVLPGKNRLRGELIERLAAKEEVLQIAGVDFGAVCPISLGISVVVDKKVAELKRVNMGSGDHLKGLEMNLPDLLKVLDDFRIEEISQ